jgi:hypothetical protein
MIGQNSISEYLIILKYSFFRDGIMNHKARQSAGMLRLCGYSSLS